VIGDMNLQPDTTEMYNFLKSNSLYNFMKEKTCWKTPTGTCIDLIISNKNHSFFNTGTVVTGLSDHHSLVYTMLKRKFQKLPPQKIFYRKWKTFNQHLFNIELKSVSKKLAVGTFSYIVLD